MVQEGTWNAPSREGKQIIALSAKIERPQKQRREPSAKKPARKEPSNKSGKQKPKCKGKNDEQWA